MSVSDTAELLAPVHLDQVSKPHATSELGTVTSVADSSSTETSLSSSSYSTAISKKPSSESIKTMKSSKKGIGKLRLMFQKPCLSRDRGLIRVCRNLPNSFCEVSLMSQAWDSIRLIDATSKKRKFCLPILYLSEWNTLPQQSSDSHDLTKDEWRIQRDKIFGQGLIRGFPKLQVISHKGNFAKLMRSHCKRLGISQVSYFPMTAVLPDEFDKVMMECEREKQSRLKRRSQSSLSSSSSSSSSVVVRQSDESLIKDDDISGIKEMRKADDDDGDMDESYWILKPQGSSKGAGIVIESYSSVSRNLRLDPEFYSVGAHHEKHARRKAKLKSVACSSSSSSSSSSFGSSRKMLAQKYISNPLLIDGRKFDLRLYLLITSVKPMCIYIYTRGLVRFAAAKYAPLIPVSDSSISSSSFQPRTEKVPPPGHLTNFAVNHHCGSSQSDSDDFTLKWTLDQFWTYLDEISKGTVTRDDLWYRQIHHMVADMFAAARPKLQLGYLSDFGENMSRNQGRCFDLLGMDVLIDEDYHCWLIETNRYCSLRCTTEYDQKVKPRMIEDLLKVLSPRLTARNAREMPVKLDHSDTFWEPVHIEDETIDSSETPL